MRNPRTEAEHESYYDANTLIHAQQIMNDDKRLSDALVWVEEIAKEKDNLVEAADSILRKYK